MNLTELSPEVSGNLPASRGQRQLNMRLTNAISTDEIDQFGTQVTDDLRHQVVGVMEQFAQSDPTPQRTLDLENTPYDFLRATGRKANEQLFSRLEPAIQQLPATIKYRGNSHGRLTAKSRRADVLTRFGKISFPRARYAILLSDTLIGVTMVATAFAQPGIPLRN